MRTVLTTLVIGIGLMSMVVMAADTNKVDPGMVAYTAALQLFNSADYNNSAPGAAALGKVLADYPALPVDVLAECQHLLACQLFREAKYVETQAADEKVLKDYPAANVSIRMDAQEYVGRSLVLQNKTAEACAAYEKLLKDYPAGYYGPRVFALTQLGRLAEAQALLEKTLNATPVVEVQFSLANLLQTEGKQVEANAAFMACVQNFVWQFGATNDQSIVWRAFDQINPQLLTGADYKTFLENTIKATKATEANAAFLGRLKSELGKMQ